MQRDRVHQERDRGVGLGLPGALPPSARTSSSASTSTSRRTSRCRDILARRPGVRARPGRAAEGVQGRPRPGAGRAAPGGAARGRRGHGQPAARSSATRCATAARWARSAARCRTSSASTSRPTSRVASGPWCSRSSSTTSSSGSTSWRWSSPSAARSRYPVWFRFVRDAPLADRVMFHRAQAFIGQWRDLAGAARDHPRGRLSGDRPRPVGRAVGHHPAGHRDRARRDGRRRSSGRRRTSSSSSPQSGDAAGYERVFAQVRNVTWVAVGLVAIAAYMMVAKRSPRKLQCRSGGVSAPRAAFAPGR